MEPRHEQIARIALAAGARYGLALAGGYAVAAHGMGNRPVAMSTCLPAGSAAVSSPNWQPPSSPLEAAGYKVSVIMSAETFTRLTLASPEGSTEEKVELAVDWRAHDPVQLAVGPVLHSDDAVANKVCALFGRALPRDFLDVDAAVMSGRYTREQLLELAAQADHGFDRLLFADALGALSQITDAAFAEYRSDPATIADMRHRFAQWRRELLAAEPG